MTPERNDILTEGQRLDAERSSPRQRYFDLIESIALGDPPDDASDLLAQCLQDLRMTGHTPDATGHLSRFHALREADKQLSSVREALEYLPTEASIGEQIPELDQQIAEAVAQLPAMIRKRELLSQIEPRRAAEAEAQHAQAIANTPLQRVNTILDELAPLAQRINR